MSSNLVYGLDKTIRGTGSFGIGTVKDEGAVRFVIENAGLSNVIRVRARIVGQIGWDNLVDLTGNVSQSVDVFTYDQIEVICLVYSTTSDGVKLSATSYNGSSVSISVPNGDDVINTGSLSFTSSDNSVIITGNANGEIDFVAVGGGGAGTPAYSDEFIVGDWVLDVDKYEIVYSAATHGKTSPIVQVFEEDGANFIEVETGIEVNSSHDITIQVSQTPDLRFAGKIIIS